MLRLHDTATGMVTELKPSRPGHLSMYVCGPTVSGDPHLGHGRFTLIWDVLRRYATWCGLSVKYVSNVTDIDDKIITRAGQEGRSEDDVAAHYESVWWSTMEALGVQRPDADPHATRYVEQMVELVEELVAAGKAYVGGDGVYFSTGSVADYGLLARQPLESLKAGARVEVADSAGKRSPLDFVLWKLAKPGEPRWPSPWGDGRPGWHTECVVMSLDLLGEGFDLHGGGSDLAFPHHENERAQACALGKRFARMWVHNAMVVDEGGSKMSKSVGNTMSLPELVQEWDPRALRLLALQSHYRSPMRVGPKTMTAASQAVERLDAFAREFSDLLEDGMKTSNADGVEPDAQTLSVFIEHMDDDLDTAGALASLFDAVRVSRSARSDGDETRSRSIAAAVLQACGSALGLKLGVGESIRIGSTGEPGAVPGNSEESEAASLAARRDEARRAKDWALSDQLREELQALGWIVEDGPDGTVLRR